MLGRNWEPKNLHWKHRRRVFLQEGRLKRKNSRKKVEGKGDTMKKKN